MASNSRELTLRLVSDASQFGRGFGQAERQATSFSRNIARAFGGSTKEIDSRAKALDASLRQTGAAVAGFFAAQQAVGFAKDTIRAFSDLQQAAGAVETVFGSSLGAIEAFAENSAEAVGLARSEFFTLASRIGGQLQNLGFDQAEAADQTIALTERAADLAATFGGPVSDALNAISAALRGERDPIERYAITLNDANVSAKALELGLAGTKAELDATDKAAASLALIMDQSAKASGQFARESDTIAGRQERLNARLEDTKAVLGEALLPIAEQFLDTGEGLIPMLEGLAPAAELASIGFSTLADTIARVLDLGSQLGDSDFGLLEGAILGLSQIPNAAINVGAAFAAMGIEGLQTIAPFAGKLDEVQVKLEGIADEAAGANDALELSAVAQGFIANGASKVDAFVASVSELNNRGTLTAETFDAMARNLRLTDDEIRDGAARWGLYALEADKGAAAVDLANQKLREFRDGETHRFAGRETARGRDLFPEPEELSPGTVLPLDEEAQKAADEAAKAYQDLAKDIQKQADGIDDALNEITTTFSDSINIWSQFELPTNEEGEFDPLSIGEIMDNLEQQEDVLSRFNDALATLGEAGLDTLVSQLSSKGPEAVGEAEALAGDLESAFEIEEQLERNASLAAEAAVTAFQGQINQHAPAIQSIGEFIAENISKGFSTLNLSDTVMQELANIGVRPPRQSVTSADRVGQAAGSQPNGGGTGRMGGVNATPSRILHPMGATSSGGTTINQTFERVSGENVDRDIQRGLLLSGIGRWAEVN